MSDEDDDLKPDGLPIAQDPDAESADEDLPAFIARPEGAPAYYGFRVLEGVEAEGFGLGIISGLGPWDVGDAFIIAPDNSRAGLVWEVGQSGEVRILSHSEFEPNRWGVWSVEFVCPMRSLEDAQRNLEALVPVLRPKWEAWKNEFQ